MSRQAPPLSPPVARQGPGRIPPGIVNALDIAVNRVVARGLPGDRRSAGVGLGTELSQLRPYQVGDDMRHLDAASSARTGEPHVRLHVPERTMTTWIALDVSPSMAFGTADRLKADVAEGVCLVLGRLAVRRAGAIGLVRFGDGTPRVSPPRGSKPGMVALRRALDDGVVADGSGSPEALAEGLIRLNKVAKVAGLVAIVSDFRDHRRWERPLGLLAARHHVLAIEVRDPRESELPSAGILAVVDPETGQLVEVDTTRRKVRRKFAELEAERRERVADELRRLRVRHLVLSTDSDWLSDLGRQLR